MASVVEIVRKRIGNKNIAGITYEGANIVVYTGNKKFFTTCKDVVREIVSEIKKRVEVRLHPSRLMPEDEAEQEIKKILEESGVSVKNIYFERKRSVVVIEVDNVRTAVGEKGKNVQLIRERTGWSPIIKKFVEGNRVTRTIRETLHVYSEERQAFLESIGRNIYEREIKIDSSYWIRLSAFGGFREVGRSAIFLHTPHSRILLDLGVNVAASGIAAYPRLDFPEFKIEELDAVVVTHAHLDHCGFVPWLFRMGYRGPVYVTEPTLDLMVLLQVDYIDVLQREGHNPPYNSKDIKEMIKHTITLQYEQVTDITPDIRITLVNAGHILGSAMVHINVGNGTHNILYTGDFKYGKTLLLNPPKTKFQRVETLIMESTYGGRDDIQPSREESEKKLLEIIRKVYERRGKVLIPVLAVGRAQEIQLILHKGYSEGIIPDDMPTYIEGMIVDVNKIHLTYPEYLNKSLRRMIEEEGENPFKDEHFKEVKGPNDRASIVDSAEPAIILATSGMLTGGPSVEYFKELAPDEKNAIIFVSYQAEGSLGRKVKDGAKEIPFVVEGTYKTVPVRLEVYSIEGFSGHSDRNQLVAFAQRLSPRPRRIIINHGESQKSIDLASTLHKLLKLPTVAPQVGDVVRVR